MSFQINDLVVPKTSSILPIYNSLNNEFGTKNGINHYVPAGSIGIIKGIRLRYKNTLNEHCQYYITFFNKDIKTDNCDNLYNEFDIKLYESQ